MQPSSSQKWVVLELTSKADNEDPDVIRASIRHHIRDAEVFVPASVVQRGEQRVYHYLMEGYAFILDKHPPEHYSRLEDTKYVLSPLYMHTGRRRERILATVTQDHVDRLRSQIKVEVDQGIDIGDLVYITSGPYKNITAVVKDEIHEHDSVSVHIQLRSTDRVVTLPRAFLRLERKSPIALYGSRLEGVAKWALMARKLIAWPAGSIKGLATKVQIFNRWEAWVRRSQVIYRVFNSYYWQLDLKAVTEQWGKYQLLKSAATTKSQVEVLSDTLSDLTGLTKKYSEVLFLTRAYNKMSTLHSDMNRMAEARTQTVNLVVDGTQLFIRCSEAPGLGTLSDSKGRPTGGIVGFLRSLGAYRKRFPQATIYVCWDGSSQRRKALYPEYKGNRNGSRSGTPSFGMETLRSLLPFLGVVQAFNPEEEADDVMATLVRGPLQDYPNIMITTDRDLLQVVSEYTHQLCPAMGGGKEKLYDPALVESEYGVAPSVLPQVRALSGDSSDNIPGIPGFGLKLAAKAVKPYGNVTSLLKSNLVGVSKLQVAKLKENEQLILANVELLTLRDVSFTQIESNPNQVEVEAILQGLEIKIDPVMTAFFPQ